MKIKEFWVTTTDNPFDPFTEYDDWYRYDENMGYCTSGYVARDKGVATLPSDAPPLILQRALEQAIDMICTINVTGVEGVAYKKVSRESDTDTDDVYVE